MVNLRVILAAVALILFAFAGLNVYLGYSGNEMLARHYMTEEQWSESGCGGCHFGFPLADYDQVAMSSHVLRTPEWDPLTNFQVESEGEDAWVREFGRYHPGGGILGDYGVDIDCMICHEQYGFYDADKRAKELQSGNYEAANDAALEEGRTVVQQDGVRLVTYSFDVLTPAPMLLLFHDTVNGAPLKSSCINSCHKEDALTTPVAWGMENYAETDVHADVNCVECHETEEHNIAGASESPDTGSMHGEALSVKDCLDCHEGISHGAIIDAHLEFLDCTACHIPLAPGGELAAGMPIASFDWSDGEREDTYHTTDFCPVLAWTDGITDGLRVRENRTEGAVLAPFNVITGSWWDAGLDSDVLVNPNTSASEGNAIPVADVKAADADGDGEVTTEEMRSYDGDGDGRADYPSAILRTVDLYYKLSHGISGSETGLADPLVCADCHGESATHIDWAALGYDSDPAETDPPTNFSAVTIDVTIPDAKPAEKEREPAF